MLAKTAPTDVDIHPLLRERWSPRAFASQPISTDEIRSLIEAARWSPSAGNGQPWSFILIPREDSTAFERAVSTLNEGNVVWAQHAPLLIVTVAQTVRDNGEPSPIALYDLGQSVAHLSVQAGALGLFVHQMGGFSKEKAREVFSIPSGYEPVTVLAIGQQGDYNELPEILREREQAPRTRKSADSFTFQDVFGHPSEVVASSKH